MKVALIHDWLNGMRGGEKCLECFCELFPQADLYTLFHDRGKCSETIEGMRIRTSFIDAIPCRDRYYRYLLPLFPIAIERFILKDYDLVLSSSHCVAKGIIPGPDAVHLSYVHSPMRYVWDMYDDYFGPGRVNPLVGRVVPFFASLLRTWDAVSSARVDHFIANSRHVARRIGKYYRREASVIHPPVDIERFGISGEVEDYYLIVSALVPYKRIDLAIRAFNRLGRRLKIVGTGPQEAELKGMAGPTIEFVGWADDKALAGLYSRCRAFVFPGEEDFGITPLEAMASGRPVIAYARGGALETVRGLECEKPTGLFFHEQTVEALQTAVEQFEKNLGRYDPQAVRRHASHWRRERFKDEMTRAIEGLFAGRSGAREARKGMESGT
ncbi:MAG TPA: glycosyltransferase [Deltaproteobacteria bacterium]|jgi:glycosyltransferase involved in cell wall biosynthesis|nr:glycosyltransferase [Deltaproteobacteria bacterium]HOI05901.1 glycosyltransferase [Deltaproteobacteria bacterium]HOS28524.1 glycosyltransferase [Deltaproteobacteria bacterium]